MDRDDDFCAFVAAEQTGLLRFAWMLTADWPAAEDLVQTALMRCWPRWSKVADGNPLAYVRRTIVNLADLSEAQAAEVLGCSVGTVKSSTSKALAKLRADPSIAAQLETT